MLAADNIYILGLRSAAPLAQFMGYYLNFVMDNVRMITSGTSDIFEQLIHIKGGDLIIGISFPRYASRTVDAIKFSKERGATTVALTDSPVSPLTNYADFTLMAKSDMASFVDSLVAPLSLINALIVAIGMFKETKILSKFNELEKIWEEYNVYTGKNNS
mgnify:FL=1